MGTAVALPASLWPTVIHVPGDSATIQAGLNGAVDGDTVLVADGTYTGSGNRDIDFGGRNIVLKSENGSYFTIIDCQGSATDPHRGFYFHSGEDSTAVVDGFTIRGGVCTDGGTEYKGGGIYCRWSSVPTIRNNSISGNSADLGGGVYCDSDATITNNIITNNSAEIGGGGIYCPASSPVISGNTISGNYGGVGGGIYTQFPSSDPTIVGNIISDNSASRGGGICCAYYSKPTLSNNTICNNSADLGGGLYLSSSSTASIKNSIFAFSGSGGAVQCDGSSNAFLTCCDVYGNSGGNWADCIADQGDNYGNFSADPLFCGLTFGDYRLSIGSACAPANNSCSVLVGALDIACDQEGYICGDANGDSLVNMADLIFLQAYYYECSTPPTPCPASDLNCDGSVDIADIVYLAQFLNGVGPEPCCW